MVSCKKYMELGMAVIEKNHEPVQVLGPANCQGGIYLMRFSQKAKPDFEGVLRGGRAILFDAKFTAQDRVKSSVVTTGQADYLDAYADMGAVTAVLVCMRFTDYYMVPWCDWKHMKELFGHLYMDSSDLETYRVTVDQYIHFLDGIF